MQIECENSCRHSSTDIVWPVHIWLAAFYCDADGTPPTMTQNDMHRNVLYKVCNLTFSSVDMKQRREVSSMNIDASSEIYQHFHRSFTYRSCVIEVMPLWAQLWELYWVSLSKSFIRVRDSLKICMHYLLFVQWPHSLQPNGMNNWSTRKCRTVATSNRIILQHGLLVHYPSVTSYHLTLANKSRSLWLKKSYDAFVWHLLQSPLSQTMIPP